MRSLNRSWDFWRHIFQKVLLHTSKMGCHANIELVTFVKLAKNCVQGQAHFTVSGTETPGRFGLPLNLVSSKQRVLID